MRAFSGFSVQFAGIRTLVLYSLKTLLFNAITTKLAHHCIQANTIQHGNVISLKCVL